MKRLTAILVFCVLVCQTPLFATLTLVPSGADEGVTDTEQPDYLWHPDPSYFVNMTYAEQMNAIAALNTDVYGGRTDWHMATRAEIDTLFSLDYIPSTDFVNVFETTGKVTQWNTEYDQITARYDEARTGTIDDDHYATVTVLNYPQSGLNKLPEKQSFSDDDSYGYLGAWVVSVQTSTNNPPVAIAQNVEKYANSVGLAVVTAEEVNNGSSDPDGDPITLSLDPAGPFVKSDSPVTLTLTVSDGELSDSTTATVTVIDVTAPVVTVVMDPIVLGPPNHKYTTLVVSDLVVSATDNCDGDVIDNVVITGASSNEADDAKGWGDGCTTNDIVISPDGKSVDLRVERDGRGDGRIYTITVEAADESGNTGTATAQAIVPHDQCDDDGDQDDDDDKKGRRKKRGEKDKDHDKDDKKGGKKDRGGRRGGRRR